MTPFPEAEIMTIKRLEVALRKGDYKLLKDGAYKLHEKFHSGHRFEYLDLLNDILSEVLNSPQIPSDVKDILCPTIEDILSKGTEPNQTTFAPNNQFENIAPQNEETTGRMNAFDAFGSQKQGVQPQPHYFSQSPFSAEPFKDFNTTPMMLSQTSAPVVHEETQISEEATQTVSQEPQETVQEQLFQQEVYVEKLEPQQDFHQQEIEKIEEEINNYQEEQNEEPQYVIEEAPKYEPYEQYKEPEEVQEEIQEEAEEVTKEEDLAQEEIKEEQIEEENIEQENKTVAIFYGQDSSEDKINNITKLRELIAKSKEQDSSIAKIMDLISQITLQADTNVVELKGVLEQLKNKKYSLNLITNSQSAAFGELFKASEVSYDLFEEEDYDVNLAPLYGLSNLFVCSDCEEKYLNEKTELKPLVLQCPKCKKPMYPDFYAAQQGAQLNMEYYNSSLVSLANSKVWLLIHPSFNDKTSADLIEAAFRVSKCVEEVYVLDKDINVRETYKYIFSKINPDVKVNIQSNALEDFLNSI